MFGRTKGENRREGGEGGKKDLSEQKKTERERVVTLRVRMRLASNRQKKKEETENARVILETRAKPGRGGREETAAGKRRL